MPTGIYIIHRIILTVGIQVQPVSSVSVLLCESRNDRIIKSGSQIVLLRYRIVLLSVEPETVLHRLLTDSRIAPGVVLIVI